MDLGTSSSDNREGKTAMKKLPIATAAALAAQQPASPPVNPLKEPEMQSKDSNIKSLNEANDERLNGADSELPAVEELPAPVQFDIPAEKSLGFIAVPENDQQDSALLSAAYLSRAELYNWAANTSKVFSERLNQSEDKTYMADPLEDVMEAARKLNELFHMHAVYSKRNSGTFKFFTRGFPGVYISGHRPSDVGHASGDAHALLFEISQNSRDGSETGDRIADTCDNWINYYSEQAILFPVWVGGTWGSTKHFMLLPGFESIEAYIENRVKRASGVAPVLE